MAPPPNVRSSTLTPRLRDGLITQVLKGRVLHTRVLRNGTVQTHSIIKRVMTSFYAENFPDYEQSQPVIPEPLPFRIVSRTIGTGAYALYETLCALDFTLDYALQPAWKLVFPDQLTYPNSIRRAIPHNATSPVVAVKFINKEHAFKNGRLRPKQLQMEVLLHQHLGRHRNVIEFFASGEDEIHRWIAMELAEGGDLFDKIEADVGIAEDIAHFYFTQLMSAVSYMHSKGVAHRDIKPENILMSKDGDLKVADFGLAALFKKGNDIRLCNTVCGSPPYIAPEVATGKRVKKADILESGYAPNIADIWSCGVVLFVLLVGNTPWDEPTLKSYEFKEYVETDGRTSDELWAKLSPGVQSLLRGMLKLDPKERFTLEEVRTHPWFTQPNPHLSSTGTAKDPVALATKMIESLRIDPTAESTPSQHREAVPADHMDVDVDTRLSSTQPETPLQDTLFDWDRPSFRTVIPVSGSQPAPRHSDHPSATQVSSALLDRLAEDPSMSQFSQNPSVPLSLTQAAKRFGDIMPAFSLTRFLSALPMDLLCALVVEALRKVGIPVLADVCVGKGRGRGGLMKLKTVDGRMQAMHGIVLVENWNEDVCEVRFLKVKGDPVEWRRLFKRVVRECGEAVLVP